MNSTQIKYDALKKSLQVFIKDLLLCEKIEGLYKFRNIIFKRVFFSGTVVEISSKNNKTHLTVDDGTANIKCIIDLNPCKIENNLDYWNDKLKENNDILTGASYILAKATQKILKSSSNDVKLGDNVKMVGKLGEFVVENTRCIYTERMEKIGDDDFALYLKDTFHLYDSVYNGTGI